MNGRFPLLAALCLCSGLLGYWRGFENAAARGRAEAAEQAASFARQREAAALAAAEAEEAARRRLEAESVRVASLAGELGEARNRLAAERRAFTRRMARVSDDPALDGVVVPAWWVRLYNEALGLVPAADGDGEPGSPAAGTLAAAGNAPAAGAGLQPGASVGFEDVLAHVRDYGVYCRSLRAQAEALAAAEKGRAKP